MKNIIFVIGMVIGLCGDSFGMLTHQQRQQVLKHNAKISYIDAAGQQVEVSVLDVGHDIPAWLQAALQEFFQNITAQHTMSDHATSSLSTALETPVLQYDSIENLEQQFLGEVKDRQMLTEGYQALVRLLREGRLNEDEVIGQLDNNLLMMRDQAADKSLCRAIAEKYKERAVSDNSRTDDYVRAAFWFRMIYAAERHNYYLEEYQDMILKVGAAR